MFRTSTLIRSHTNYKSWIKKNPTGKQEKKCNISKSKITKLLINSHEILKNEFIFPLTLKFSETGFTGLFSFLLRLFLFVRKK